MGAPIAFDPMLRVPAVLLAIALLAAACAPGGHGDPISRSGLEVRLDEAALLVGVEQISVRVVFEDDRSLLDVRRVRARHAVTSGSPSGDLTIRVAYRRHLEADLLEWDQVLLSLRPDDSAPGRWEGWLLGARDGGLVAPPDDEFLGREVAVLNEWLDTSPVRLIDAVRMVAEIARSSRAELNPPIPQRLVEACVVVNELRAVGGGFQMQCARSPRP